MRLRPILMTTVAMIFGMLPVAFGVGEGAETRSPMGVSVIGGLLTSLFLTLAVVPAAYDLFDDGQDWLRRGGIQKACHPGLLEDEDRAGSGSSGENPSGPGSHDVPVVDNETGASGRSDAVAENLEPDQEKAKREPAGCRGGLALMPAVEQ